MQDIYGFPGMDETDSVLRDLLAEHKAERAAQVLTAEEAAAFANWTRVSAEEETRWLAELSGDDGLLGFEPPARPDSAWVLNAMYEVPRRPADAAAENAGNDETGWHTPPAPDWRRLRWAELAGHLGVPVVKEGSRPDRYQVRPRGTRDPGLPGDVLWPEEGSLDWETWHRLIDLLIEQSPEGADTRCLVHFCRNMFYYHVPTVLAGRLGDAYGLIHHPDLGAYSPSNVWPEDRSWVTFTHYDLHGTKVAGPTSLIEALLADPGLEALRLPWAP
ncbi:hypothetical protein [Streptomyces monomycini]|uniref:hypothetical protein n=1 Tax=Streptomyces monomycini TaxID=371720 RepID=UPI00067C576B|nr:hypothetical protein [Streptomyces monomycini]